MPRCDRQGAYPAFQIGHALFKHITGGVHDAGINIAEFLQGKQAGGMFGAVEYIGSGLINGNSTRTGSGIRLLPGMQLAGGETELAF